MGEVIEHADWLLANGDAVGHHFLAIAHAAEGRREQALTAIRNAAKDGYAHFASMQQDPDLAPLHGDADFNALFTSA